MAAERQERRSTVLSEADIGRIEQAFDKRLNNMFEVIGYDISTPKAREDIRKDHAFVRDARRAKGKVIGGFLASVGAGIAALVWSAIQLGKQ